MNLNFSATDIVNNLPGIVWVKDDHLKYIACNQGMLSFIGFNDKKNFIDLNDYDLPWQKYAEAYRNGDRAVLSNQDITFLHPIQLCSGKELLILTKKSPIKNSIGDVVGVIGMISIVSNNFMVQNIKNLYQSDNIRLRESNPNPAQYILSNNFERFGISKQESLCLFYLIRGKTAKEMAYLLKLAPGTIEKYMESIRFKLNCNTRSEVISKAIDLGFVDLLPSNYFIEHFNK